MKKFSVIYLLLSVVIFIFIYVMTLVEISASKTNDTYYALANEANLTKDVKDFIRFSTDGFMYLDTYEDDTYHIDVVQIKVMVDDTLYYQIGIFVLPKVEVEYATSLQDDQDLSRALVLDNETTLFDSDTYQEIKYPMSYGISLIGFYFYAFEYDQAYDGIITLYDYSGNVIYNQTLAFSLTFDDAMFIEGFTEEELEMLIGANEAFESVIIDRITLFVIVDITALGIILFIWKWMKRAR